jgi:prenyltransferase beta subunit
MYEHGISTLMLSEVAGMTDAPLGKKIREAVRKAVKVILTAQRTGAGKERGGWRYQVKHVNGSDISVTGWQIMALRAARNIGCDVPVDAIDRAVDFIKRCQDPVSGGFKYEPNSGVTIPCTGTSILALELCGKNLHKSPEVIKAGNYLLKNIKGNVLRGRGGFYYYMVYYCSQATFQLGDGYWNIYREEMHKALLPNQNAQDGSWKDPAQGDSYATAMAVLALAVEYRYLPIYQRSEEPAAKDK